MNNLTDNLNFLTNASFKLVLNSNEFANTEFFCVTATLPALTLPEATTPFRNQKGYVPGETLEFDTFNVRLMLDAKFAVYDEIFNWMMSHTRQTDVKVIDMSLMILGPHNTVVRGFTFKNAFPTSLGSIEFNAQASDIEYPGLDVTFRYDSFAPLGYDDFKC